MPFRYSIRRYQELASTNTSVQEFAKRGAKEGLVVHADYQTRGRGKPGNHWVSERGENLLFSILLRPPVKPAKAPLVTQIACRSVAAVLKKDYKIESQFKRPNDILVDGRKICGVLVEASSQSGGKLDHLVIGIGLNVNTEPKKIARTISMRTIKGKKINREKVFKAILSQLRKDVLPLYAAAS